MCGSMRKTYLLDATRTGPFLSIVKKLLKTKVSLNVFLTTVSFFTVTSKRA